MMRPAHNPGPRWFCTLLALLFAAGGCDSSDDGRFAPARSEPSQESPAAPSTSQRPDYLAGEADRIAAEDARAVRPARPGAERSAPRPDPVQPRPRSPVDQPRLR